MVSVMEKGEERGLVYDLNSRKKKTHPKAKRPGED